MNKALIKAELRRAAATGDPWAAVEWRAYEKTFKYHSGCVSERPKHVSYFFLLVAEAL